MSSFHREAAFFLEKEEMDDYEWNFPLYSEGGNGMESSKIGGIGMGGNGNGVGNGHLVSDINQSVSSMDVDLNFNLIKPEEIDLDLFGTSNITLGSEPLASHSVSNGNFDFNSILDPILFQAQTNSEVKPEFTFNYPPPPTSEPAEGDLFTNHHLSLGTSKNSNNINESPILFSNAYDAPSQPTQPVPATSLPFIDPQTLLSPVPPAFSPLDAQASKNAFTTSPSSMTDVAVPDMSPLISDLDRKVRGESMSSEDEDGMPQTPGGMSTLNGAFGFGGIGMMGTPLVGDESLEDTLGLFNFGGFNFSNLTGLNPSGLPGSNNTSGASPLLDQNKPGMKELLKMFPGLANLDQDMLEKILTPPSSNTSHSTSFSLSQLKQQKRSVSRVSDPSTGSPALEGFMVRDEIAKRRRTPAEKLAQQEREKSLAMNTEFGSPAPESRGDIRRRSSCTNNHRKLIDLNAPTQTRNYISSSTTSRKPTNTTVSKRKAALLPDGSHAIEDEERVEKKRRQNTLSARRSRARRQEVLEMLEDKKREINLETEEYKRRCEEAERRLKELRGEVVA